MSESFHLYTWWILFGPTDIFFIIPVFLMTLPGWWCDTDNKIQFSPGLLSTPCRTSPGEQLVRWRLVMCVPFLSIDISCIMRTHKESGLICPLVLCSVQFSFLLTFCISQLSQSPPEAGGHWGGRVGQLAAARGLDPAEQGRPCHGGGQRYLLQVRTSEYQVRGGWILRGNAH